MTVFRVRFIPFEPLVGLTNNFAQISAMLRRCVVPMFDQDQGQNLRLNIVRLTKFNIADYH